MLKTILLASAVMISAPAIAQETSAAPTTAPVEQTTPMAPAETAPATPQTAAPAQTAQAQPAEGAAATPAQIAQIVEQEFPKYDKESKGELSEAQFGEWMVALRSATEPNVTADNPEMKAWVSQAFASADADKSKAVTKAELTTFLSQGA